MADTIDNIEEMQSAFEEEEQLDRSMETGLAEYLASPGKAIQQVLHDGSSDDVVGHLTISRDAVSDEPDSLTISSSSGTGNPEAQEGQSSTPKVGSKQWMETVFPMKDAAIARNKLPPVQYSPAGKPLTSDHNVIIVENGRKLMQHFDKDEKWRNIFLIKSKEGLGLSMPEQGFGIDDVIEIMGATHTVSTIDVFEQHSRDMTLEEFRTLQLANEKPYNILSLEFSKTEQVFLIFLLANFVSPPDVYRMMSLADFYWPESTDEKAPSLVDPRHRDKRPRVERFCLIGMGGSFTDFHIDFGGSSVWYHVFSGKKVFYVVPPTKENLNIYQRNEITKDQFLADIYGNQCWRVEILPGQTLIIPAGWIHAVHTPEDSIVFGGNFLTMNDVGMQCEVHAMERRHTTGKSFFYPEFELVNWYAARTLAAQLKDGKILPPHHLEGAKTLLSHLIEWKKIDKKGKKSERKFIFNDTKSSIVDKLRKALEGVTNDDIESVEHLMDRSIGSSSQTMKRRASTFHEEEPKRQKLQADVVPTVEPVEDLDDVVDVDPEDEVEPPTPKAEKKKTPSSRSSRVVERRTNKETLVEASRAAQRQVPMEMPVSEGRSRERRFREKVAANEGSEEDLLNQLVQMSEKVSKSETKLKANEKKMRDNRKMMEEIEEKLKEMTKLSENNEASASIQERERKVEAREKRMMEDEVKMKEREDALKEALRLEREKKTKEMEEAKAVLREKEMNLEEREKKVKERELKMAEREREFSEKLRSKTEEEEIKRSLEKKEQAAEMEERERLLNLKFKLRMEGAEAKMAHREQALRENETRVDGELEKRERTLREKEQKIIADLTERERRLTEWETKMEDDEKRVHREAERALGEMRAVMMEKLNREKLNVHQELKMAIEEEMKLQKMILEASMEEELKREKLKIQELKTSMEETMKKEKSKIQQELRMEVEEEMKKEKSRLEQELKTSMEDEITLRISEVQEEKRALGEMKQQLENEAARNDAERRRLDAVKSELNEAMTSLSGLKNSLDEEKAELEAAKKAMKDYKTGHRLAKEQKAFHARMREEWEQLEREKARDEAERAALEEERRVIEEEWRKVEAARRSESREQVEVVEEIELPVNCQNKENKEIKKEAEEQNTLMIAPPVQLEKKKETEREVKQEEPEEPAPMEPNSPMINPTMEMQYRAVELNQMEEPVDMKDVKPLLLDGKRRRKSTKKFEPNPHQSFYEYE